MRFATLNESLKNVILEAYVAISRANQHIAAIMVHPPQGDPWAMASRRATESMIQAGTKIAPARDALLTFLGSEK